LKGETINLAHFIKFLSIMRSAKLVKIIDFFVLLMGWSFMFLAGYCLVTGQTLGGLVSFATLAVVPAIGNVKKEPNFVIEAREGSKGTYYACVFNKEFWVGLSLVKQSIIRANALGNWIMGKGGFFVNSELVDQGEDVVFSTINTLTLDKRSKVEELGEIETATYNRLKANKEKFAAQKEAKKNAPKKGKVNVELAKTEAKIEAFKEMAKEGLLTPEQLADRIASIS
jgi:hypothetical protein